MSVGPSPATPARRPWLVLLALVPGIVLTLADATIMSVAVPLVIQRLDASVTAVSWIMNGYNLVLTVLFLPMGRLGDRWGHKRTFVLGLALFTAASLGCARTGTIEALIAWRAVQAVGAAAVIPTALTILLAAYPAARRGFAAGMFGAISSAAAALGPTLGGVLIDRWSWQAVFWFNIPVGLLGIGLALALLPRRSAKPAPAGLDLSGAALAAGGLFCLTLGLIQGNPWGWTSARILGLLAGAAVLLAAFFLHEARAREPFLDLSFFKRRSFAASSAAIMTVDTAMMGTTFMLVIYMVAMLDYTELKAGVVVTTLPLAGFVLAPFAGRIVDRAGPRLPALAGALLTATGLILLAFIDRTASAGAVAWRTALVGAGLGLSLPALTAAGMSALPADIRGLGSGVLNTARQLGFLLGVAVLVAVFSHTMQTAVGRAADQAKAMTNASAAIPADLKPEVAAAIDSARGIDVSLGMSEIMKIAHPIAEIIEPRIGPVEGLALLGLKDDLETLFMDEAASAFRWPMLTAAIAALLALIPSAMLPMRLPRDDASA
jgi:DHA2 family methylenomycin A resistance protein-like MFS transporter